MLDQIEGRWKHVAFIIGTKLLAGDAEWGARNASRDKVNTAKIFMAEMPDVLLNDVPVRPVFPQSRAELWFIFNRGRVMEASHFKAEGLTATTGTKLQDSKTHAREFELICKSTASG